jgi:hypothetical protein
MLMGPPGTGKTEARLPIAEALSIQRENIHLMRPSLMEPTDLVGVPTIKDGSTVFAPPKQLTDLRTGRHLLVVDETAHAVTMLQNALGGLILDRFIGGIHLSPEVFVLLTGNRVEDKAGSNRMVSQVANRLMRIDVDVSAEEWCDWALENGVDPMMVAFIKLRPELLFDFDPNRFSNATPRSVTFAANVDPDMPGHLYFGAIAGICGEGFAAEYIGFRKNVYSLPPLDKILSEPDTCPVPKEPEVRYALVAWLSTKTTLKNFHSGLTYMARLPIDFQVLFMKSVSRSVEGVMSNRQFVDWATRNVDVFKTA